MRTINAKSIFYVVLMVVVVVVVEDLDSRTTFMIALNGQCIRSLLARPSIHRWCPLVVVGRTDGNGVLSPIANNCSR